MVGKDCVAIAADRRFGVQAMTLNMEFQKIFSVTDRVCFNILFYILIIFYYIFYYIYLYICFYSLIIYFIILLFLSYITCIFISGFNR
jgi:hypothetical protein